ncbi:MAG: hypothetical protein L0312_32415, partial [Acidobacteria bacterium]|nr:hypothetical protein [Acidobacteriota bacterium]
MRIVHRVEVGMALVNEYQVGRAPLLYPARVQPEDLRGVDSSHFQNFAGFQQLVLPADCTSSSSP